MTKWKALSKAFLVLGLCFYYWASNPVLAQDAILVDPGIDILIQDEPPLLIAPDEPLLAPIEEPVLAPTPTYSPNNPFANSEYTDLADIAEDWLQLGGNIDQYFYSEGFTTGTDGTLGNEHLCIRDDFNKVYVGRSDVCVDRQAADYEYIHFDQINLDGFDSLAQLRNSMLDPDQIYQTGDLLGDTSQYWDGCYTLNQRWAGTSGGQCPTINDQYGGQINYGYVEQTLTNTAAIDLALKNAGLETTGYTYSWLVKNADANYENANNPNSVDPFQVTVSIYDDNKNLVFEKTYDYSRWIDSWERFSGSETFDTPFDIDTLSEIQLSITGYDIGYWAGYYGPEFREPDIRLNYRVAQPTGPSPEEILKEQMCMSDPKSDPTCPGYNDAMIAQIASTSTVDDVNSGAETVVQTTANDGSTGTFDDTTGTIEQLADATGAVIDDGSDTGSDNGMSDPVAEATPDPVQEAVAEATPNPVQEAAEQATETTAAEAAGETKSTSTGLNATQLSVLDAANSVATSAVSMAEDAAQTSAGIGLSDSGGVSSTLTGIDSTSSTSIDNDIAGGTDTEFSADSNSSGILDSSAQLISTDNMQTFELTQDSTNLQDVNENVNGSDNAEAFELTQDSTNLQDVNENVNGSDTTGTMSENDSNSGSDTTSDTLFGTAELAEDTAQDSNPLADGVAIETNDITGEEALAVSNESILQLATLTDPSNPINQIINEVTANLLSKAVDDSIEIAEESSEDSVESQNEKEDALVAEALAGSDDEDAQAALLGYNPNFRAYQQPQMPGGDIYNEQGVYLDQKTYDNPRAGLFNGASDATHRAMVRSQYK